MPARSDWWDKATEAVEGHLTYLLLLVKTKSDLMLEYLVENLLFLYMSPFIDPVQRNHTLRQFKSLQK